jgi:hypothetical protein
VKRETDPRLSPDEAEQRDAVYEDDVDGIEGLSVLEVILMVGCGLYLIVVDFFQGIARS